MATLTAYTAALQTIDTREAQAKVKTLANGKVLVFVDTVLLDVDQWQHEGCTSPNIYRITNTRRGADLVGKLVGVEFTYPEDPDSYAATLTIKPLGKQAAAIARAVLDNLDAQEQKPEGKSFTFADLQAMRERLDRQAVYFGTKGGFINDGLIRLIPERPWVVYRESEGNNP